MPHKLIEVSAPMLSQLLGDTSKAADERATVNGDYDTGLRAIMFTDIEGSTDVSTTHGDEVTVGLVRRHDGIVRKALAEGGGREIKHTGDGMLASFAAVSRGVQASVSIQGATTDLEEDGRPALRIKIGLSAGEPVEDGHDLYGAAVTWRRGSAPLHRGARPWPRARYVISRLERPMGSSAWELSGSRAFPIQSVVRGRMAHLIPRWSESWLLRRAETDRPR